MSHVYAVDQGLGLQNETVDAVHYDDATSLLLIIKGGVVFAYDLSTSAGGGVWGPEAAPEGVGKVRDRAGTGPRHDQLVWTYPLQEGPGVRAMRCSLDRQMLALCRSLSLVELVDLSTGNISVHTLSGGTPTAPPSSPSPKSPILPLSTSATISPEPRPPSPLSPARLNFTWGRLFGKSRSSKSSPTSDAASHSGGRPSGCAGDMRAEGGGMLWGFVTPATSSSGGDSSLAPQPVTHASGDATTQGRTSPLVPSLSATSPATTIAGLSPQGCTPGSPVSAEGGEGGLGGGELGRKGGFVDKDGVYCSSGSVGGGGSGNGGGLGVEVGGGGGSVAGGSGSECNRDGWYNGVGGIGPEVSGGSGDNRLGWDGGRNNGGLVGCLMGDYFGAGSSSGPSPSPTAWPLSPESGPTELQHHNNMHISTAQQQQQHLVHQSPESAAAAAAAAAGVSVLLGLVFSETPGAEIMLAGTSGLELCVLAPKKQGIRCATRVKLGGSITSFTYTHETRCAAALVTPSPAAASALGVSSLPVVQAWQLLPTGLITLPSFTLVSPSFGSAPAALPPNLDPSPPNLLAGEGPCTSQLARPNLLPPEPLTQIPGPAFSPSLQRTTSQFGSSQQGVHRPMHQQERLHHQGVPPDQAWWAGGGGSDCGNWGSGIGAPAAAGLVGSRSWGELQGLPNPLCVQGASGSAGPLRLLRLYNCVFACHISEHTTTATTHNKSSAKSSRRHSKSDDSAQGGAEDNSQGVDAAAPAAATTVARVQPATSDADAKEAPVTTTVTTTVLLRLYRFFTDSVKLQHTYALHTYVHAHGHLQGQQQGARTSDSGSGCSSNIALSVVDNVLVVQMENARRVVLIDILADPSQPLTPPMPLALLQPPRIQAVGNLSALRGAVSCPGGGSSSSSSSSRPTPTKLRGNLTPVRVDGTSSCGAPDSGSSAAAVAVAQIVPLEEGSSGEGISAPDNKDGAMAAVAVHSAAHAGSGGVDVSRPSWRSYLPNLLVDCSKQGVYRLVLDLQAAAASIPDPAAAAAFLLRRRASRMHAQRLQLWPLLSPASSYVSSPAAKPAAEAERQWQQGGLSSSRLCSPRSPKQLSSDHRTKPDLPSQPVCTIKGGWVVLGGGEGAESRPLDCHGYLTPPKLLVLALVRNLLQDRAPASVLRRVFAHLCFAFAEVAGPHTSPKPTATGSPSASPSSSTAAAAAAGAAAAAAPSTAVAGPVTTSPPKDHASSSSCLPFANPLLLPPTTWCVLTPEEVAGACFGWALETGVLDALGLQAALAEYAAAAAAAHVPVPLPLQRLRLDLLLLVQPPAGPHQPPCSHFLRFATPTPTSPTATVTHAVHSEQLPAPPTLQPHLLAAQLYCQWGAVDPSLADHLEGMLARFCATTPLPPPLQRLIHATRGKGAEGEWEEPYGGVWEDHDWLWEDQGSSPSKCMAADVAAAHDLAHTAWNGSLGLRAHAAAASARAQRFRQQQLEQKRQQQQQQLLRTGHGSSSSTIGVTGGGALRSAGKPSGGATLPPPPPPPSSAAAAAPAGVHSGSEDTLPSTRSHPLALDAAPAPMQQGAPATPPSLPHLASTPSAAAAAPASAEFRAAQDAAALVHALLKGGQITRAARATRDLLQFLRPTQPAGPQGSNTTGSNGGGGGGGDSGTSVSAQQQQHLQLYHPASSSAAASSGPPNDAASTSDEHTSPTTSIHTNATAPAASHNTNGAGAAETATNAVWLALPLEVLAAAAHTGNTVLAAAVYRCFAPYLAHTFPSWESVEFALGLLS